MRLSSFLGPLHTPDELPTLPHAECSTTPHARHQNFFEKNLSFHFHFYSIIYYISTKFLFMREAYCDLKNLIVIKKRNTK